MNWKCYENSYFHSNSRPNPGTTGHGSQVPVNTQASTASTTTTPGTSAAGSSVAAQLAQPPDPTVHALAGHGGAMHPVVTAGGARQRHPNVLWQYSAQGLSQRSIQSNVVDTQTPATLS